MLFLPSACDSFCSPFRPDSPRKLLQRLPTLVKKGGVVVLVSPYSWLHEYTPKSEWLGGYSSESEPSKVIDSFETVAEQMQADGAFALVSRKDMPFLIREHARKFQIGVSDCSVWRRTA